MTPPPAATLAGTARSRAAARPTTSHRARDRARRPGGTFRSLPRPVIGRPSLAAVRSAVVDRLFGGRAWIAVLGTMLLGLVFLQVSLLQLNTQISTDIGRSAALERGNAEVRSTISRLAAGRRVQDVAQRLGMILPGAGAMCYLSATHARPCQGGRESGSTAQAADSGVVAATPPPGTAAATAQAGTTAPVQQQLQQPVQPAAAPVQQPATPAPVQQPATTAAEAPAPATGIAPVAATTGGQAAPQG